MDASLNRADSAAIAAAAGAAVVGFDQLTVASNVWWLQTRPDQAGRVALMTAAEGRVREATAPNADVGGHIHAYGGGAYAVDGTRIWYTDASDQRIHVIGPAGNFPSAVQPGLYGNLTAHNGGLLCIRETDTGDQLLHLHGPTSGGRVLLHHDGFLAAPTAHGRRLAWLSWPRDEMPWDSTRLWASGHGTQLASPVLVAGGNDESIAQPRWMADGTLLFLSDRTGWWNLYRWDGTAVTAVASPSADLGPADWELGYRSYVPIGERIVVTLHEGPRHSLAVIEPGGVLRRLDLPYTSVKPYLATDGKRAYAIASSPTQPPHIAALDLDGRPPRIVAAGPHTVAGIEELVQPSMVTVDAGDGVQLTALVYPPAGVGRRWRGPVVVRAHPGPTAAATMRLDWQVQFLTSHGIAVADVDYRGSTGYGRPFRQELYGRWGQLDVADCTTVARHLIEQGHTHAGQVFISGASAGGYTALRAVSHPGSVFAGAVARSAILDPGRWTHAAPRWQRPHAAKLAINARPVTAGEISRPVLLIHGATDHVAGLDPVLELVQGLKSAGVDHELITLGGAGHRLTAQEENARALHAELAFYRARR